ncbi:MAG: ribosome silencing factor [Dehalococcoidia bacterium]
MPAGIELAHRIVDVVVDRLAEDVLLLDLTALGAFADYFVIATVDNERQMSAVVESVEQAARASGFRAHSEGAPESGWVLVEVSGVVVHLFSREQRERYDLEGLWAHAREVVRVQ